MPAYAYLRKSVVHDLDNPGASPAFQEEAVRRLAGTHGDADGLVILSDWDKSGRLGADKRPGYRALLDAIESGRATAVYSYSLSRLARSVPELSRLMADCAKRGIPVRLDADRIDTSTASGMLTAHVLAAVAQFEADVASERVRAAIAVKVANGERIGTVPFYGDAEADDAPAVLAAFREAGSYSGAARLLNARGIKPRNSKRGWWPSSVNVVINRLDPSTTVLGRTKGVRAGGSDFALARLLRCPTCGTQLTGTRDREGRRVRYSCRLGTVLPHPRISVTEHLILPAIKAETDRLRAPETVEAVKDDARKRPVLEARRTRILDMYESGDIDKADKDRRLAEVAEGFAKLDSRRVVMAVPTIDWSWPPKKLNAVLRALFDRVELDAATFQPTGFEWAVPEWRA
jgi:DNA invertase Pin-like site-specific DNA recombinase